MPAAIALVLGRIFAWVLGSLVLKLIAAFGIGFVVMTGVDALIDNVFDQIQGLTSGLDSNVVAILGMLRIDDAISVIAAAVAIRLSLQAFNGGFRKLTFGNAPAGP